MGLWGSDFTGRCWRSFVEQSPGQVRGSSSGHLGFVPERERQVQRLRGVRPWLEECARWRGGASEGIEEEGNGHRALPGVRLRSEMGRHQGGLEGGTAFKIILK